MIVAGSLLVGCGDELPQKSAGEYCQRDEQCIEGLVCLSRRCVRESTGTPRPFIDAGPEPDAGFDAGFDAGPDEDAGADEDAGTADDAGTDEDGGVDVDAAIDVDASIDVDAGT